MKAYLIVTGIVFTLLTAVHISRIILEGKQVAEVSFVLLTTLAAARAIWAFGLFFRLQKS